MLETLVKERGIYYVIMALCALGVAGKFYESRIYKRLLVAVENPEKTEHPFIKQLKLKYKNCYKLERRIHNIDAFIETSLFRYKHRFMGLESLHTVNTRIMLLCIMVSCLGIAGCVHFQMGKWELMYYVVAGAVAVAGLELMDQQFGNDSKKRMLFVALKDYLENGLTNQLVSREKEEEQKPVKGKLTSKNSEKKEEKKQEKNLADIQVAVAQSITEKVTAEMAQEKVIAEVIKEFFP